MTSYPDPRPVSSSIPRPAYVPVNFFTAGWGYHDPVDPLDNSREAVALGTDEEKRVRAAGKLAAEILANVRRHIKVGTTTNQIDEAVHEMMIARGAYPSTLGYGSFPRSCTTSVNNIIAHGIPDDRPLDSRDIINVDLTIYLDGYHGDTSATFVLPDVDSAGRDLVEATKEALELGIKVCGPGVPFSAIGQAIEKFADKQNLSMDHQFAGHGIGKRFHQLPHILHYHNNEPGSMRPGDCFTIEPALIQGPDAEAFMWDDGWTMSTLSGARSAQFEHQILITEDGADVLTRIIH